MNSFDFSFAASSLGLPALPAWVTALVSSSLPMIPSHRSASSEAASAPRSSLPSASPSRLSPSPSPPKSPLYAVSHPNIASEPAVSCEGISVSLSSKLVLSDVSFKCGAGEWLSVIGPNGAGKTTLLRVLSGMIRSQQGRVHVCGGELGEMSPRQRARQAAVISQHPIVPPGVKVLDYVLLGRVPHLGFGLRRSEEDHQIVRDLLRRLQAEQFADAPLSDLSGGERQRIVVARALAQETPVLLLDEPTSALDIGHQLEVLELLDELRKERGLTIVSTTHDLTLAGQFADRLLLLADGKVAADGRPAEVLTREVIEEHYGAQVEILARNGGVALSVKRGVS